MKLPDFLVDHPDGEIRLTGHRIAPTDIIELYQEGYSPEMMALEYPTLPLPLVYNVVAFYLNNQAQCDKYAQRQRQAAERFRSRNPHLFKTIGVADVRKRFAELQKAQTKKSV